MNNIFGYKIEESTYPQMKIIETPKFIFRPMTISDILDVYEYLSQEKVVKHLSFKVHKNINYTKRFIQSYFIKNYKKGRVGNYAIYHKTHKKVIGNIGLNNVNPKSKMGEIGICINPKYWGNNLATELTIITLITAFEILDLDKIISKTYQNNKYTPKSLNNLNFRYVKSFKDKKHSELCNIYELTKSEYMNMKADYLPSLINKFND